MEPDRMILSTHEYEKLYDFSRWMGGDRICWVGEITEPPEGYDQEIYCLHIRTAEKPMMVFGLNEGDLDFLTLICFALLEKDWPLNEEWLNRMAKKAEVQNE